MPRLVQHRPRREGRGEGRELAERKRDQHRLEHENRRLREDLDKAVAARPRRPRSADTQVSVENETCSTPKTTGVTCGSEQCGGSDVRTVSVGPGEFLVCPTCKWRKRVK